MSPQQKVIILELLWQTHLTLISWMSGTNLRVRGLVSEAPLMDFLDSASCCVSGLGLTARERGVGGLQSRNKRSVSHSNKAPWLIQIATHNQGYHSYQGWQLIQNNNHTGTPWPEFSVAIETLNQRRARWGGCDCVEGRDWSGVS